MKGSQKENNDFWTGTPILRNTQSRLDRRKQREQGSEEIGLTGGNQHDKGWIGGAASFQEVGLLEKENPKKPHQCSTLALYARSSTLF